MERALSVPSKLFLSGEYAVLWGGTARIAAVGPRAHAYVRSRDDREVRLLLEAGGLRGYATALGVNWQSEISAPFLFAARTVDLALGAHGRETLGFDLALSSSPSVGGSGKPGMGGSARATLLCAESVRFVLSERFDPLKLAIFAHVQTQGGRGSGGDVAAVHLGGVVRYRRYPVEQLLEPAAAGQLFRALAKGPPVDVFRLPLSRIRLSYAFAGASASTPQLISEVEHRLSEDARARFVQSSDELGQAQEEAMIRADFATIRRTTAELHQLLASLGPLETDSIRRILSIARSHGIAGKLSGAGGGDGCILFAPDVESQSSMLSALKTKGFWATALELEAGLVAEPHPDPTLQQWLGS